MTEIYTASAFIGARPEQISITSLDAPSEVVAGRTGTASVTVENTSNCDITVNINALGSQVGSEDIRSGSESFGTDFDFAVPDDGSSQFELLVEVIYGSNIVASRTKTITISSISELINIESLAFDGINASGRVLEGTVTVSNGDTNEQEISVLADGSQKTTESVFSGRSRDITFDYTLPEVAERKSIDVTVEATVNGSAVSSTTKSVDVRPMSDFIRVDSITIPETATSGETIDGFDDVVTVSSDIGDVTIDLEWDGVSVGSKDIISSGSQDIGVELQMPKVEGRKDVDVTIDALVSDIPVGSVSTSVEVLGPSALINIDSVNLPNSALSGRSIEVTTAVRNTADGTLDVTLYQGERRVSTKSVSGGRTTDYTFSVQMPEVDGQTNISVPISVEVGGVKADNTSPSVSVDTLANKVTIQNSDSPSNLVVGETGIVSITFFNSADVAATVDLALEQNVKTSKEIQPSGTSTLEFEYTAPYVQDSENITLQLNGIVAGNSAGTTTESVTVKNPKKFITIKEFTTPTSVTGGKGGEGTVVLGNSYTSSIDAAVEYDGQIVSEKTVRPSTDSTSEFVFDTEKVEEKTSKDVKVLAIVDEQVADQQTNTVTVLPKSEEGDEDFDKVVPNRVSIDTEEGTVTVKSSYTRTVDVSGTVRGTGVSINDPVSTSRPLGLLPGSFNEKFSGELPEEFKGTIVEAGRLNYIDLELSQVFVWTVDGKKEGRGNVFKKRFITE